MPSPVKTAVTDNLRLLLGTRGLGANAEFYYKLMQDQQRDDQHDFIFLCNALKGAYLLPGNSRRTRAFKKSITLEVLKYLSGCVMAFNAGFFAAYFLISSSPLTACPSFLLGVLRNGSVMHLIEHLQKVLLQKQDLSPADVIAEIMNVPDYFKRPGFFSVITTGLTNTEAVISGNCHFFFSALRSHNTPAQIETENSPAAQI
ncbi:hypothetical protein Lqui_2455 [Legionella quinlivanii]|uniref:Uncharacterized protein n=1 Tax=Legionella quinlivanii TaxID=45073 RepID=A0A0W0XQA8_9GAMM|nr:hypothetical protein [Legionella quinlivanii]KTD46530.1 hypothetical protein Lqui_2455 [Legionella quinlivanii]SEG10117.1 hypothetical protein SAMN02746093_01873 [Legionella quinlivanii DSM 21216]STY10218.1 Uncharacterised protein [Legionella quinlivanii]